jgi:hypothetical protein
MFSIYGANIVRIRIDTIERGIFHQRRNLFPGMRKKIQFIIGDRQVSVVLVLNNERLWLTHKTGASVICFL